MTSSTTNISHPPHPTQIKIFDQIDINEQRTIFNILSG